MLILRSSGSIDMSIKGIFRKLTLARKFSVAVIFMILVIMLLVNTLIISYQRTVLKTEIENTHFVVARNLVRDAVEPLLYIDPLRLDELVMSIANTPGCMHAGIIDRKGRIVGHTDRKLLGQFLPDMNKSLTADVLEKGVEYVFDVSGNDTKEIFAPVRIGYEVIGMAGVGFSKSNVNALIEGNLKKLKNYVLIISAGIILLGIWGAFIFAGLLAMPMKKLKDKMELVQAGNLDAEIRNDNLVNCWELLACEIKGCPAYGKTRCWTIPGTLCFSCEQKGVAEKICDCKKCFVYKTSCGDEVGELIEVFNQMIKNLKNSLREIEETNKERSRLEKVSALGEMSMTVAHEIKNPLNAILGAVSYLQDNFKGEVLSEFLEIIKEETNRLNELVTSFLRFSRPAPLNVQLADINKIIRETVELVRQEATGNNVEVVTRLDEKAHPFRFDIQQIKQALLNIFVNALEVTREGDAISIESAVFDSRVRIVIKDTGTGMSEETISEIFKPFFTTKTRGSGLGLACVERIIRDHKGDISVKSEAGKGTEFTIILPLVQS
ncbi:MAG: two-component sensor histidine kinase [Nitrospira bacterium HGW-Nitrospira-1]|nr:MAG: two-component sensor histidine kinase [Nitrospira bacterium HGW-Nitrospira-1]